MTKPSNGIRAEIRSETVSPQRSATQPTGAAPTGMATATAGADAFGVMRSCYTNGIVAYAPNASSPVMSRPMISV